MVGQPPAGGRVDARAAEHEVEHARAGRSTSWDRGCRTSASSRVDRPAAGEQEQEHDRDRHGAGDRREVERGPEEPPAPRRRLLTTAPGTGPARSAAEPRAARSRSCCGGGGQVLPGQAVLGEQRLVVLEPDEVHAAEKGLPLPFQSVKLTHSAIRIGSTRKNTSRISRAGETNSQPARIALPERIPRRPPPAPVAQAPRRPPPRLGGVSIRRWPGASAAERRGRCCVCTEQDRLRIARGQALRAGCRSPSSTRSIRRATGPCAKSARPRTALSSGNAVVLGLLGRLQRRHHAERLGERDLLVGRGQGLDQPDGLGLVLALRRRCPSSW